mgnify:FL=1
MRRRFPNVVASVLMHNHLHLLLPEEADLNIAHRTLKSLTRSSALDWEPIPNPEKIRDPKHGRRQIRYINLNPCRNSLCKDPLEWPWSTYRGYFGAIARPWVPAHALARAFGWKSVQNFLPWFHEYVSSDSTVCTSGTPVLKTNTLSGNQSFYHHPHLERIREAVLAASESTNEDILRDRSKIRKVVVHLASETGWTQTGLLSRQLKCTPRFIQYCRKESPDPSLLQAARVCLGDRRIHPPQPMLDFVKREM